MYSGLSAVESRLLAGSNEKLGILHGCVLQDSMAEIEDVASAVEFGNDVEGGLANLFGRSKENRGIKIALDGDAWSGKAAEFGEGNAPIDAEDVGTGFHDRGEEVVRGFGVINDWNGVAKTGDDILNSGEDELGVFVEIEFAAPGVEKLYRGSAGVDLALEVGKGGLGDAVEKLAEDFGLVVEKAFDRGKAFFGAAFDHIAGEGPR